MRSSSFLKMSETPIMLLLWSKSELLRMNLRDSLNYSLFLLSLILAGSRGIPREALICCLKVVLVLSSSAYYWMLYSKEFSSRFISALSLLMRPWTFKWSFSIFLTVLSSLSTFTLRPYSSINLSRLTTLWCWVLIVVLCARLQNRQSTPKGHYGIAGPNRPSLEPLRHGALLSNRETSNWLQERSGKPLSF